VIVACRRLAFDVRVGGSAGRGRDDAFCVALNAAADSFESVDVLRAFRGSVASLSG